MSLAGKISALLRKSGKKQKELAAYIGVAGSTMNNWLTKDRDIPAQYVIPICDFFGIRIEEFLGAPLRETKKEPVLGISENGRAMLELYERLSEREQLLLLGRLQEMVEPLTGMVKRDENTGPETQAV